MALSAYTNRRSSTGNVDLTVSLVEQTDTTPAVQTLYGPVTITAPNPFQYHEIPFTCNRRPYLGHGPTLTFAFTNASGAATILLDDIQLLVPSCDSFTPCDCGDFISESMVLQNDINCGSDTPGLFIASDNIIVDGNGHTIASTHGVWRTYFGVGIIGKYNVTIKNLTIFGFSDGIRIEGGGSNHIHDNHIYDQYYQAVRAMYSQSNIIENSNIHGTRMGGIQLTHTNGHDATPAIYPLPYPGNNIVRYNTIYQTEINPYYLTARGIEFYNASGNQVYGNTITRMSQYGIDFNENAGGPANSTNNYVADNIITNCGCGIDLTSQYYINYDATTKTKDYFNFLDFNIIQNNTITGSTNDGIRITYCCPPSKFINNTISGSGGHGVNIWTITTSDWGARTITQFNEFNGNKIYGSMQHGIYQNCGSNDLTPIDPSQKLHHFSTITNNEIYNNGGYGVYLEQSSSNTIIENQIYGNTQGGVGIYTYSLTPTYGTLSKLNSIEDNFISGSNYGVFLQNTIDNTFTGNEISGSTTYGAYLDVATGNLFHSNTFSNAVAMNAYETSTAINNAWNLSTTGNLWSDCVDNPGYPGQYIISGSGGGIDYWPNCIPPEGPTNPGSKDIGLETITWTWQDASTNEIGFKIYDDPGAGPPATFQIQVGTNVQEWQHAGLAINSQYAFQVGATDGISDSAKTPNYTAWTLIEPVSGLVFPTVTLSSISVASTSTPSNLASGMSGLHFANVTTSVNSGWQQTNTPWVSSSLTPNTQYTFSGTSRNGASVETPPVTTSKYTLIEPVSGLIFSDVGLNAITVSATDVLSNLSSGGSGLYFANTTAGTNSGWQQNTTPWPSTGLAANSLYAFSGMTRNGDSVETVPVTGSRWTLIEAVEDLAFPSVSSSTISVASSNVPSNLGSADSGLRFINVTQGTQSGWQQTNDAWVSTGLTPAASYEFQALSRNGAQEETLPIARFKFTIPVVPIKPTLGARGALGLKYDITLDGNSSQALYAMSIRPEGGIAGYVQADGTVGPLPFWQPALAWAGTWITGLTEYTQYHTKAIVMNGEGYTLEGPEDTAWTLDVTPPTGSIAINGGAAQTNSAAVTLTLSAGDSGSGTAEMQFSNDNATWTDWEPYGTSKSWTLSSGDGAKTVYVRYRDASGNMSLGTISTSILLDTVVPEINLGTPSVSLTASGPVDFVVTYADPGGSGMGVVTLSGDDITLNKTGTANAVIQVTGSGLNERTVTLSSITGDGTLGLLIASGTATDLALNPAPGAGPSATFIVDNTAPTVTVTPHVTSDTTPIVSGTVDDANGIASMDVVVNSQHYTGILSGSSAPWIWQAEVTDALAQGIYDVFVTAVDLVGMSGQDGTVDDLQVDLTVPNVTVNLLATNNPQPTLTGTASSGVPIANVTVKVGPWEGPATVNGTEWSVTVGTPLPDAVYDVQVTATDTLGKTGSDGTTNELTVDTTGPRATEISPITASPTNATTIVFSVHFDEPVQYFNALADLVCDNGPGVTYTGTNILGGAQDYTVEITGIGGNGTLALAVSTVSDVQDLVTNALIESVTSIPVAVDHQEPTAEITLDNPTVTDLNILYFSVIFSENVGASFTVDDISLTGDLGGTAAVSGADPDYTVMVTLFDPDANGTIGIDVGTDIFDLAGNGYSGDESPLYTIAHWPGFVKEPADAQKYTGDSCLMETVIGAGPGTASYQWKWDDGNKAIHDGPAASTWLLSGLAPGSCGHYWCEVTYNDQVYSTRHAELAVQDHLAVAVLPPNGEAETGGSYTFTVETTGGYEPLAYIWSKDGTVIPDENENFYTKSDLSVLDSGTYTVAVSDAYLDDKTASASLIVNEGLPLAGIAGLGVLVTLLTFTGIGIGKRKA